MSLISGDVLVQKKVGDTNSVYTRGYEKKIHFKTYPPLSITLKAVKLFPEQKMQQY